MGRGSIPTLPPVQHALAILAAYLIGSVNFGILVAASRGVDIRSVGSGNPGTSNVLRVLGKKLAAVVLLGDALKGVLAAAIGVAVGDPVFGYVTLAAAVIGHSFPIWHRLNGGKSVATAMTMFSKVDIALTKPMVPNTLQTTTIQISTKIRSGRHAIHPKRP